jgi:CheY-like chemotaxis protein
MGIHFFHRFGIFGTITAAYSRRVAVMPISLQLVEKAEKPAKGRQRPPPKEKEPFLPGAAPVANPPVSIGRNRRILVVDDNLVVLKAFELKLKSDGFAVTTTANSAAVASTAEQAQAELIVLDINFPPGAAMEWNGFTVMQWLRRFPELGRIPVILISGSEAAEYKEKALAAGALAFFQKPVGYQEILDVILKRLDQVSTPAVSTV